MRWHITEKAFGVALETRRPIGMDTETLVECVFRNLGFHVDRIAEDPGDERADYRIGDSKDIYFFEVKEKTDADSVLADYLHTLDAGNVFLRSEPTGYKNAVSNVLDKADSQLSATAESISDFRMVWLQLSGLDRNLQFQQALSTIYGTVQLLPIVSDPVAKDCYYFKNSVVHRRPNIDAFIISDGESLLLATNPFSPRFHALPSTRLYGVFAEQKALVNPVALEQAGEIYVADCSVPRRDTQAVLEYVQRKYGVDRFLDLEPVCTTASAEVKPRPSV